MRAKQGIGDERSHLAHGEEFGELLDEEGVVAVVLGGRRLERLHELLPARLLALRALALLLALLRLRLCICLRSGRGATLALALAGAALEQRGEALHALALRLHVDGLLQVLAQILLCRLLPFRAHRFL